MAHFECRHTEAHGLAREGSCCLGCLWGIIRRDRGARGVMPTRSTTLAVMAGSSAELSGAHGNFSRSPNLACAFAALPSLAHLGRPWPLPPPDRLQNTPEQFSTPPRSFPGWSPNHRPSVARGHSRDPRSRSGRRSTLLWHGNASREECRGPNLTGAPAPESRAEQSQRGEVPPW